MSENDILYRHLRDDNNVPYATLAAVIDGDTMYVGASYCSEGDNFSYKKGRQIATYRLNALLEGKELKQLGGILTRNHIVEELSDDKPDEDKLYDLLHLISIDEFEDEHGMRIFKLYIPYE